MNRLLAVAVVACFIPCAAGAQSWTGKASYYSGYRGRTASGARFLEGGMTAAHRTLPFGTSVKVTNLENGRWAVVVVNDRGPFVPGRVIDVSTRAAEVLAFRKKGIARVRVDTVWDYSLPAPDLHLLDRASFAWPTLSP
jgi:rare lipoprotein A